MPKRRSTPSSSRRKKDENLNPQAGRVIANYGAIVLLAGDDSKPVRAVPRKRIGLPVAGDHIIWSPQSQGDAVVLEIEPRRSVLERPDQRRQMKPVAANLTQLVIVSAVEPGIDLFLIDQYAVYAELMGIDVCIAINKADLITPDKRDGVDNILDTYRALGYTTVLVDTLSDEGFQPILDVIEGETSIFVGQSGVGKSSLINRIMPDLNIRVGALSDATGLGGHTTTTTTLYPLQAGTELIDSPGVREFTLNHLDAHQVAKGFPEIRSLAEYCRFNNCTHKVEPACAVREAEGSKTLNKVRYKSYLRLLDEIEIALEENPHYRN